MGKSNAVQPEKIEVKAAESVATVVADSTASTAPKAAVATAAAVKKVAAKPRVTKSAPPAATVKKEAVKATAPAPKAPAKAVQKAPAATKAKAAEAAEAPKVVKAEKPVKAKKQATKKPKLVRDSFTIPETDYALFASIKQRALTAGVEVKKGEILRAALASLAKLGDAELLAALGLVERIKTGRPKK